MRILVTGGAGFLGSFIACSLLNKGHQVTVFDDFSNSSEEKISMFLKKNCNFDKLQSSNPISVVRGDVTNFESVFDCSKNHQLVIHLASKIDVPASLEKPEVTNMVNVAGSLNVLRSCEKNKIDKIIVTSSAAVYGNPAELPLKESSKVNPMSPYGASKLAMESYVQAYSNSFGIDAIILRPFNVYGVGQSMAYAGVITKFMERISKNEPLLIYGDGNQSRDFVSVEDVVNAFYCSMDNLQGKRGRIYNVASSKPVTVNYLAELMLSMSGKDLEIRHVAPRSGDIYKSEADTSLAKEELGFKPKVNLADGLKKLLTSQGIIH